MGEDAFNANLEIGFKIGDALAPERRGALQGEVFNTLVTEGVPQSERGRVIRGAAFLEPWLQVQ